MKRVALITGGRRGIGFGIARALAGEGFRLAICDIAPKAEVQDAMDELRSLGAETRYYRADVTEPADRDRMLAQIKEQFGPIHVLINNAGVAPEVRQDILSATEQSFERVMRINLQGPYFLTQAVANRMIEAKQEQEDPFFCIVNIASSNSQAASVDRGEYCISKAGVSMATKLWAVRLAEYNIPVYEIRPGVIKTDMTKGVRGKYDALIEEGLLLQRRWGLPEDIGAAVAALARGDLAYSTGQVLYVDGGQLVDRL